jgi:hypothetical protein
MRVPIICVDSHVRQFVGSFGHCFSLPQHRYFVTVLVALLLCQGRRTLTGLRRQVAAAGSLAGLSRFLAEAPWDPALVAQTWRTRFDAQVQPLVAAEHARQRAARPKRRGRPPRPVVTGYLIGDDSTMQKVRGKKMAGLGRPYSTTAGKPVVGHRLVQSLSVVAGRRCPLAPQLYRQQVVCARAGVSFQSKVDLMATQIATFTPLPGTQTHVLLDSWSAAKRLWTAARQRGFLITTGLKSNRSLRVPDPEAPCGWRWQTLADYAAGLTEADYQQVAWPSQQDEPRPVWVHVVDRRVRTLYRCQVVIVRETLDGPLSEVRYWASSDLTADLTTLVGHLAARWVIEVLFADTKEELGLDQYQVMSATAVVRFWTLVLTAYVFLEAEQDRLRRERQSHVTIGEARAAVQRRHWRLMLIWLHRQLQSGEAPQALIDRLVA